MTSYNKCFDININYRHNKKYNCSGTPAFENQRVGYQSNQILLHHFQHSKNLLN